MLDWTGIPTLSHSLSFLLVRSFSLSFFASCVYALKQRARCERIKSHHQNCTVYKFPSSFLPKIYDYVERIYMYHVDCIYLWIAMHVHQVYTIHQSCCVYHHTVSFLGLSAIVITFLTFLHMANVIFSLFPPAHPLSRFHWMFIALIHSRLSFTRFANPSVCFRNRETSQRTMYTCHISGTVEMPSFSVLIEMFGRRHPFFASKRIRWDYVESF